MPAFQSIQMWIECRMVKNFIPPFSSSFFRLPKTQHMVAGAPELLLSWICRMIWDTCQNSMQSKIKTILTRPESAMEISEESRWLCEMDTTYWRYCSQIKMATITSGHWEILPHTLAPSRFFSRLTDMQTRRILKLVEFCQTIKFKNIVVIVNTGSFNKILLQ
jgi:hypothetical protein